MTYEASQLRWEPPEGPAERKDVWERVIAEVIEDYPEADVIVAREKTGPFWTVVATLPDGRALTELTLAIVAALGRANLPAKTPV
jgi:hypothetical protein